MIEVENKFKSTGNDKDDIYMINPNTYELNIRPAASILNVFSRLSYKVWYAIAEFVDNSTQSYLSNVEEILAYEFPYTLSVRVNYNEKDNTLIVQDNAYGMEIDRFRDAILLDSKNSSQTGRNEFGMGLKTAASWFGNVWSVTSTRLGSENCYSATIDILKLKNEGINNVQIHRTFVDKESHGTTVFIQDVTKKITGPRTIGKIRALLSSMYRRDINNRNIEIYFNDYMIQFEDYPVLKNFRGKAWKKPLNFDVEFEGQKYNVTGFVAIMNPGSFTNAGFALFRRDRVVIGGSDLNYKPTQIFGQAQSQRSLKLFGELNMDDFPVNQAKDGFDWDDGLEDAFIDELRSNIQDYIDIAEMSKKERESEEEYSIAKSEQLKRDIEKVVETMTSRSSFDVKDFRQTLSGINHELNIGSDAETKEYVETVLNAAVEDKTLGSVRVYNIPLNSIYNLQVNVQWATGNIQYWIDCSESDDKSNEVDVKININHPFFIPYSKDEEFKKVLEKFVLAFVVAERQAKATGDRDGYILSSSIRNNMNRFLAKLAED